MNRYLILTVLAYCLCFAPIYSKERPIGTVATVEIPEDWESISERWIDLYNSAKGDSSIIYVGGFYPLENSDMPFNPPYITYNFEPDRGMWDGMKLKEVLTNMSNGLILFNETLGLEQTVVKSLSEFQNSDINAIYIDDDRGIVLSKTMMELTKGDGIVYQVLKPTSVASISINLVAYENDKALLFPIFNKICTSIKMKEGMEFVSPESNYGIVYAIFILVVLSGIAGWITYSKKKTSK